MNWLKDVFGTKKAIIAMCHMQAMPGDPYYNKEKGIEYICERAKEDLMALQDGGVDGVMFSNEYSLPYLTDVKTVTVATMAKVIGELKSYIKIPFGVNVLWDAKKSIDLAVATGARFVREIFTGVYASDFGLWNTNCGEVVRHRDAVAGEDVKLLFNIVPEAASYLAGRDIVQIAKTTVFNCKPDGICVSGITAGAETDAQILKLVKDAVPNTVVIANTGVRLTNVDQQLSIADAAIVGTTFKIDGIFENGVDIKRVKEFMEVVRRVRS